MALGDPVRRGVITDLGHGWVRPRIRGGQRGKRDGTGRLAAGQLEQRAGRVAQDPGSQRAALVEQHGPRATAEQGPAHAAERLVARQAP